MFVKQAGVEVGRPSDAQTTGEQPSKTGAPTGVIVSVVHEIHLGGIDDITFTTALLPEPP